MPDMKLWSVTCARKTYPVEHMLDFCWRPVGIGELVDELDLEDGQGEVLASARSEDKRK
jgi:hypothetical protein